MNRAPVRIAVVDAHGRSVPEATVSVVASSAPFPEIAMLTDEFGVLELLLPEGRFTFGAHGSADRKGQASFECDGEHATECPITVG
ncbi:MAG: hypothetical protein AAF662_00150 [Pseudomonadota bacterium]